MLAADEHLFSADAIVGYGWIKNKAKELGCSVRDLLALAPGNDPFYMGAPASVTQAEWFAREVWAPAGFHDGGHLRRAHYWKVSRGGVLPNGKPYENTEACWNFLLQASKAA